MKLEKKDIDWYIIADTKINPQTFTRLCNNIHSEEEYEKNWIKRNSGSTTISQQEKLLEFMGIYFLNIPNNDNSNLTYIEENFQKLSGLFQHFHITVLFNNVSHLFVKEILLKNFSETSLSQSCITDLSLWLPPVCEEDKRLEFLFGNSVGEIYDILMKLDQEKNDKPIKQQIEQLVLKMIPQAQTSNVIMTSSIKGWRNMFIDLTSPSMDDEIRYVFMRMIKDFKIRFYSFFQDIICVNNEGKLYGTDTIFSSKGAWKNLCLIEKK